MNSAEQDPVQRLLAFAYMQAQKDRRQAEEELRKDSTTLSAVIAVQHRIAALQLELEPTLELIVEEARRLTGAGGAAIALRHGDQVVCRASSGLIAPEVGARLNPRWGVSGECLRSGDIQHVDDTEADARVDKWVCRNLGMRSILAVPLRRQQDVLGILEAFSGWAGVFGEREIRTLKLLAGLVIEALWSWEAQGCGGPSGPKQAHWAPEAMADVLAEPAPLAGFSTEYRVPSAEDRFREQPQGQTASPPQGLKPGFLSNPGGTAKAVPFRQNVSEAASEDAVHRADKVRSSGQPSEQVAGDETHATDEPEIATVSDEVAAPMFSLLPASEPRPMRRVLALVAAAVALLGVGSEVVLGHGTHFRAVRHVMRAALGRRAVSPAPPVVAAQPIAAEPQPAAPLAVSEKLASAAPAGAVQLTSIKYWSKAESTTVGIFLDAPVRWQSEVLSNPDRIYFDLDNTRLPAEMLAQSLEGAAMEVEDGVVRRVRVAPKGENGVRVVIDLAGPAEHSAVLSPAEPYRLMISVRGTPRPASALAASLQAPKNMPAAEARKTGKAAVSHSLKIVIDPGHGGTEDGAVGRGGLKEKDLVLAVSKHLGELLSSRLGVEVIYTRADDRNVPLEMRAVVANEAKADLLISVHANYSSDLNARGVETYYVDGSAVPADLAIAARENAASRKSGALASVSQKQKLEESRKLAIEVQRAMYRTYGGDKGVNRGVRQAPFVVLLDADMPSILTEVAFVSSTADEQWLSTREGQAALAEGLYRGITRYLSTSKYGKVVARLDAPRGAQ